MATEYTIYCDESSEKGDHFSDFYGGVLVQSKHIDEVKAVLAAKKKELNFFGEVKWGKVPGNVHYLQKYIELMTCFFGLVAQNKVKVRIMFRQNTIRHKRLTRVHIDQRYFILYYTFLKKAFGLDCSPNFGTTVRVRIYPDKIPDTAEQVDQFRSYLVGLSKRPEFRERRIVISKDDVTDVVSHKHDILQCLDIVLGAMHFKLNDLHKEIEKGKRRRAKRTRAKHKLYKHINLQIRSIYRNFNIGVSTAQHSRDSRWSDPYRHWRLMPSKENRIVLAGSKKKKKRGPGTP